MLQVDEIRENKEDIINRLANRNFTDRDLIDKVILTDNQRKKLKTELDGVLAESNQLSKMIGSLYQEGKRDEAEEAKKQTARLKESSKKLHNDLHRTEEELKALLVQIPNVPHPDVPAGKGEEDNLEVESWGELPEMKEEALPHWELAEKYDLIDFRLGVKVTGAGFPVYKGKGAKLQRALINFFLNEADKEGYEEVLPPHLVNEDSGFGTGQLPDKEGQMYHIGLDHLYLIPTAEVPITNLHRDEIYKPGDFPIRQTGYTPCFRREAGSYGKDVKGLNRLHQFDKVEIVQVQHPDKSYDTLEEMKNYVAGLVKKLGLPYRVLKLCGGDLGFASAFTYDFETYSAAQQRWLEVSSVSNFESYQANRLKLRFKEEGGKTQLCHTLNGSALALPRIVATLLENNQTPDGIKVPEVLVPFTGFEMIN